MKSITLFKIAIVLLFIGVFIFKYNMDTFGFCYIIACVLFLTGMYKFSKE